MSKPRKSSAALAAREKARAKAEEITRRNEELIELAAGFFIHEEKLSQIEEDTEKKIAELQAQAEEKKVTAKQEAAAVVAQMLEIGESKKSIAVRLGLSTSELKSFLPPAAPTKDAETGEDQAEDRVGDASTASRGETSAVAADV